MGGNPNSGICIMKPSGALQTVKLVHTLIWAFFAACIVLIPLFSYLGSFRVATVLIGAVALEVMVLAFNRGSCPLTGVAARYTDNRQSNFDIYLPEWLARYNKAIFGTLYIFGVIYTLLLWM